MKATRRKFLIGTVSAIVLTALNVYDWRLIADLQTPDKIGNHIKQSHTRYVGAGGYSSYISTTGNATQVSFDTYLNFPHVYRNELML